MMINSRSYFSSCVCAWQRPVKVDNNCWFTDAASIFVSQCVCWALLILCKVHCPLPKLPLLFSCSFVVDCHCLTWAESARLYNGGKCSTKREAYRHDSWRASTEGMNMCNAGRRWRRTQDFERQWFALHLWVFCTSMIGFVLGWIAHLLKQIWTMNLNLS